MKKVNLTAEQTYGRLKDFYEVWHRGCSCETGGDFSYACYAGNYVYRSGNDVVVFIHTGTGEHWELLDAIELKDGTLWLVNDNRNYIAPWYTTEKIYRILRKS